MRVLDIFSGIGGFSLGLERAGMRTVAFCEIDPYCRKVLGKHWPGIPLYGDVRDLSAQHLTADGIGVDLICGGFPCQDISAAGKGAGIEGERSGLWSEYARLIGELRPRYAIVENVAAILGRGLERVLGDLAEIGFDAEWHCIPASAVGAPHRRDRLWLVAYPRRGIGSSSWDGDDKRRADALTTGGQRHPQMAHAKERGLRAGRSRRPSGVGAGLPQPPLPDADCQPTRRLTIAWRECGEWLTEPDVGRVAHGISARVDRLRSLGNAVVPQIPQIIGEAIMAAETKLQ